MIEIRVLGNFSVSVDGGKAAVLSVGSQRLLVFLTVCGRFVSRSTIAGTLWPDANALRAGESLRSALSRMEPALHAALAFESGYLGLASDVTVDLRDATALAQRLAGPAAGVRAADLSQQATVALSTELLSDWFDDWIVPEAEDWRQLRMNALEAQVRLLIAAGQLPAASGAARAAVRIDPLRESAQASLLRVHLAEGNQSDALRIFEGYRTLLLSELGLEPTAQLTGMVQHLRKQKPPVAELQLRRDRTS